MPTDSPPRIVWWLVWAAILAGFFVTYAVFFHLVALPAFPSGIAFIALAPLAASIFIRLIALPGAMDGRRAFILFVMGLAMAEAAGLIGIILSGEQKPAYAAAAIVLLITYAPAFVNAGRDPG